MKYRPTALRASLVVVLAALLFAAPPSRAETSVAPIDVTGNFTYYGAIPDGDGNAADVKMDLRVHLSTLMGEPVTYCTGRWQLYSVRVGDKVVKASSVPADVWRGVELVGVKFAFPMSVSLSAIEGTTVYLPCDPGVFYGHGDQRASFNVPGSPSWKGLLLESRWLELATWNVGREKAASSPQAFMAPQTVKSWLVQRKIDFSVDSRGADKGTLVAPYHLIWGSVNLWSVRGWLEDQERAAQAERKQKRLSKEGQTGAARSKLDDMFAEVDAAEQAQEESSAKATANSFKDAAAAARKQRKARLEALQCAAKPDAAPVDETSLSVTASRALQRYSGCKASADLSAGPIFNETITVKLHGGDEWREKRNASINEYMFQVTGPEFERTLFDKLNSRDDIVWLPPNKNTFDIIKSDYSYDRDGRFYYMSVGLRYKKRTNQVGERELDFIVKDFISREPGSFDSIKDATYAELRAAAIEKYAKSPDKRYVPETGGPGAFGETSKYGDKSKIFYFFEVERTMP